MTKKCILNINNGADNILFKTGFLNENSSTLNKDREKLFYLICIPLRILLACIILYLSFIKNPKLQNKLCLAAVFITFFMLIHLYSKYFSNNECKQWWSNEFEIFLTFTAFILSLYCYFRKRNNCMLYISILFFVSILAGLIQSFVIKPFN